MRAPGTICQHLLLISLLCACQLTHRSDDASDPQPSQPSPAQHLAAPSTPICPLQAPRIAAPSHAVATPRICTLQPPIRAPYSNTTSGGIVASDIWHLTRDSFPLPLSIQVRRHFGSAPLSACSYPSTRGLWNHCSAAATLVGPQILLFTVSNCSSSTNTRWRPFLNSLLFHQNRT